MCSNNSSANASEESGVSLNSCFKKPLKKRARVPKRGPGVAELEKILREEKSRVNSFDGFSSPAIFTPLSNPPATVAQHFFTSLRSSTANISCSSSPLIGSLRKIGGSSISPEKASSPVSWKTKSNLVDESKSKSGVLSEQYFLEQRPPMINDFPGSGSPPARLFDHIEHPSSQKSNHNHIFSSPEQEKMVGMKNFSAYDSNRLFHDIQISLTCSSAFAKNKTREGDSRKYGAFGGDFRLSCSPNAPPSSKQSYLKKEDCHQRSEEGENEKPFYCFLQLPDITNCLNEEIDKADRDAIDLNLKL